MYTTLKPVKTYPSFLSLDVYAELSGDIQDTSEGVQTECCAEPDKQITQDEAFPPKGPSPEDKNETEERVRSHIKVIANPEKIGTSLQNLDHHFESFFRSPRLEHKVSSETDLLHTKHEIKAKGRPNRTKSNKPRLVRQDSIAYSQSVGDLFPENDCINTQNNKLENLEENVTQDETCGETGSRKDGKAADKVNLGECHEHSANGIEHEPIGNEFTSNSENATCTSMTGKLEEKTTKTKRKVTSIAPIKSKSASSPNIKSLKEEPRRIDPNLCISLSNIKIEENQIVDYDKNGGNFESVLGTNKRKRTETVCSPRNYSKAGATSKIEKLLSPHSNQRSKNSTESKSNKSQIKVSIKLEVSGLKSNVDLKATKSPSTTPAKRKTRIQTASKNERLTRNENKDLESKAETKTKASRTQKTDESTDKLLGYDSSTPRKANSAINHSRSDLAGSKHHKSPKDERSTNVQNGSKFLKKKSIPVLHNSTLKVQNVISISCTPRKKAYEDTEITGAKSKRATKGATKSSVKALAKSEDNLACSDKDTRKSMPIRALRSNLQISGTITETLNEIFIGPKDQAEQENKGAVPKRRPNAPPNKQKEDSTRGGRLQTTPSRTHTRTLQRETVLSPKSSCVSQTEKRFGEKEIKRQFSKSLADISISKNRVKEDRTLNFICDAVAFQGNDQGCSVQAIRKYIRVHHGVEMSNDSLKKVLEAGLLSNRLIKVGQSQTVSLVGRYRLGTPLEGAFSVQKDKWRHPECDQPDNNGATMSPPKMPSRSSVLSATFIVSTSNRTEV